MACLQEATVGIEPTIRVLQTLALPLGDVAAMTTEVYLRDQALSTADSGDFLLSHDVRRPTWTGLADLQYTFLDGESPKDNPIMSRGTDAVDVWSGVDG